MDGLKNCIKIVVVFLLCMTTLFAEKVTITVDAGNSWRELPHYWSRIIGTGHAGLLLDSALQDHIKDGVENLGIQGVRQHGTFHEDVGIYSEVNGHAIYNWERFDSIYDFLGGLGLVQILELGFMPADLAEDSTLTIMKWNAITSKPKDYVKWGALVEEVVLHLKQRYGEDLVESMRFEVWNEPDLNHTEGFWSDGTQEEYFELYKYAAEGIKRAHSTAKVGGPTPSGAGRMHWISELLTYTQENSVPIDFVTYHTWHEFDKTIDAHFEALDIVKGFSGYDHLESINTEMGPTWQFGREVQPHETEVGAAFYAKIISDISRRVHSDDVPFPFAYAWWVLSDVFEEGTYFEDRPFISCMGLTTREGLHKPIYNVFKMLHAMGDKQIQFNKISGPEAVNGFASTLGDTAISILVYNSTAEYNPDVLWEDTVFNPFPYTQGEDRIEITVDNILLDTAIVVITQVDKIHSNAYTVWEDQGRPVMSDMSVDNWESLYDASVLDTLAIDSSFVIQDGSLTYVIDLPREGVAQLIIKPRSVLEQTLESSSEKCIELSSELEYSSEESSDTSDTSDTFDSSSENGFSSELMDSSSDGVVSSDHETSVSKGLSLRNIRLIQTNNHITLYSEIKRAVGRATLYTIHGQKVLSVSYTSGRVGMSTNDLVSGLYVVKLEGDMLNMLVPVTIQ
ncbi:MAG: hypothetical protein OCD01_00825 [Fibrobacterales bacterium]